MISGNNNQGIAVFFGKLQCFADRIIGMTGGRVVFDGEPDALTSEHLKLIYGGSEWLQ